MLIIRILEKKDIFSHEIMPWNFLTPSPYLRLSTSAQNYTLLQKKCKFWGRMYATGPGIIHRFHNSSRPCVGVSDPGAPGKLGRLNLRFFWRRVWKVKTYGLRQHFCDSLLLNQVSVNFLVNVNFFLVISNKLTLTVRGLGAYFRCPMGCKGCGSWRLLQFWH